MHFVYKLDTLVRSMSVSDENSFVTKGTSFFLTYYNSRLFVRSLCTIQTHVVKFQPFVPSFAYFHAFTDLFWAKWPWNWKSLQMNSKKVETWHGIIISPTWHVQKSRDGYDTNWMHFVYKLDTLFRSIRVSDENSSVTPAIQNFNNLLQLQTFLSSLCTIQSHVVKFQPFLT